MGMKKLLILGFDCFFFFYLLGRVHRSTAQMIGVGGGLGWKEKKRKLVETIAMKLCP